jgi:hypothetical protein
MLKLRVLLWVVAISQLLLGALVLFVPGPFFLAMGLSAPPANNNYMLGMLAARFIAYGLAFVALARAEKPDAGWIRNMALIQVIDFAVGLYYTTTGVIGPSVTALPMFNAAVFACLLWLWQPRQAKF